MCTIRRKKKHITNHDDSSILEIKIFSNYLSCFPSGPILPRNTVNTHKSVAAFSKRRGNGPSTRCAFTSGCAGTGRANINQWSQEWNQGGRVVPHNAATGEVRERCTPCLVSIPHASLPTHTHTHTRHLIHTYVEIHRKRNSITITRSPGKRINVSSGAYAPTHSAENNVC